MSLAVHGLGAVLGWTALMLLSYAPGPVPTVALIIALALLVGCVTSLLHTAVWYGAPARVGTAGGALAGLLTGGRAGKMVGGLHKAFKRPRS